MKKIIAMAAMLLAVVLFAYTYRLQTLAWLQFPAFAVTEKDITDTLKADGTPEEDKEVLSMRACTEDEALYRGMAKEGRCRFLESYSVASMARRIGSIWRKLDEKKC